MELYKWPADILKSIIQFLTPKELLKLKGTGDAMLMNRLTKEPLVLSARVKDSQMSVMSLVTSFPLLRRLCINLGENKSYHYLNMEPSKSFSWVMSLPKTLEDIDFDFKLSHVIWIRPPSQGELLWPFTSREHGYAPLYLCDLLPNLKRLRLVGSWLSAVNWDSTSDEKLGGHFLMSHSHGCPIDQPARTIIWTPGMVALFLKKLPEGLISLECDMDDFWSGDIPFLPPRLARFKRTRSLLDRSWSFIKNSGVKIFQKESLAQTLTDFTWCLGSTNFREDILLFKSLETLDLSLAALQGEHLSLLPSTLRTLTLCAAGTAQEYFNREFSEGIPDLSYQYLALIPRSITSLKLLEFAAPPLTSPNQTEQPQFVQLLPSSLTKLSLQSPHDSWLASVHLAGCTSHLPNLRTLKIKLPQGRSVYHQTSFILDSFAWVPTATLRTFVLSSDGDSLILQDSLFKTWPDHLPNNIENFSILGNAGKALSSAAFPLFPPRLKKLALTRTKYPITAEEVFEKLPRTLTEIDLRSDRFSKSDPGSAIAWSEDALARIFMPRYMRETLQEGNSSFTHTSAENKTETVTKALVAFPRLRALKVEIVRSGSSLPSDMTTLHKPHLEKPPAKTSSLMSFLLHRTKLASQMPILISSIPSSITSLKLPITLETHSPVWTLRQLHTLSINGFLDECISDPRCKPWTSLKWLNLENPLSTRWFNTGICKSLDYLSIMLNDDDQDLEHLESLFNLNNITRLKLKMKCHSEVTASRVSWSIPTSVTWLETSWNSAAFLWPFFAFPEEHRPNNLPKHFPEKLIRSITRINAPLDCIAQKQLKIFAPHLTSLTIKEIIIGDRILAFRGLDRNLTSIADIDMVRSICPSVIELNGIRYLSPLDRPKTEEENYAPISCAALRTLEQVGRDQAREGAAPNLGLYEKVTDPELMRPTPICWKFAADSMHRDERGKYAFTAMPPSLTRLATPDWNPTISALLPRGLTWLDIRASGGIKNDVVLTDLPETLTMLALCIASDSHSQTPQLHPDFCASIPRNLKTLMIDDLMAIDSNSAKALPPGLTHLKSRSLRMWAEVALLPQSIRKLVVCQIDPAYLSSLPANLRELICTDQRTRPYHLITSPLLSADFHPQDRDHAIRISEQNLQRLIDL